MKRGLVSIILILILIFSTTAIAAERGEDLDKQPPTTDATSNDLGTDTKTTTTTEETGLANSYQWLYDTITNRTVNDADEAIAIIALLGESSGELGGLVDELKKRESDTHCWPKDGCRVKDTALATLALSLSGQDVTEETKWLKESKISMGNRGEWWIVLKSNVNGTCTTTYNTKTKNFDLQDDIIKQARGQYHINLLDIDPNINRVVTPKISVDCSTMPSVVIALIYKPDTNTFFIQESQSVTNTDLIINNACYPVSRRTNSCDFESTAFATWALLELQTEDNRENLGTTIYLESAVKQGDSIQLALLNRILLKLSNVQGSFLELLAQQQKQQDGSFNNDVYATALSLLGLQGTDKTDNIARAADYLTRRVSKDGSWNRDVRNTAYALLALHGIDLGRREVKALDTTGRREICGNSIDDNQNGIEDCGEQSCSDDQSCKCVNNKHDGDEEGIDCGGNCGNKCAEQPADTGTTGCTLNSDCNSGESCQSGICITNNDNTNVTEPTPEEGSSFWIWLLVILFILLAGFGVFYIKYVKTGKIVLKDLFKKKKKQTFEEYKRMSEFKPAQQRPAMTQNNNQRTAAQPRIIPQRVSKSKEEEELERSLKEAEKLIKGNK
ncbi:MAG: hypothetical protein AABW52_05760 [Nanoarchaeota archaeon]